MNLHIILLLSLTVLLSSCGQGSDDNNNNPLINQTPSEVEDFSNYLAKRKQDQTIIPKDLLHLANPTPDLNTCEQKFAIKIGVIDTGVDYNNPLIKNNIAYNCNEENMPIGFGRDDLGQDDWASPYLCLLYTSPSPRDRQKSRMPSSA